MFFFFQEAVPLAVTDPNDNANIIRKKNLKWHYIFRKRTINCLNIANDFKGYFLVHVNIT